MPRIVPSLDTAPRDNLRHLFSVAPVIAALSIGSEIFVPIAVAILLSVALGAPLAVQLRCLAYGMPRGQSTMLAEIEPLRELLSGGGSPGSRTSCRAWGIVSTTPVSRCDAASPSPPIPPLPSRMTPMPDLFFEDFNVGATLPEATLTVEAEDAAAFSAAFGPGATTTGEAQLPLSGWHVAALGMRLLFDAFLHRTASLGAPGIDEVTWPHPVRPGDRLRFTAQVAAARISASRPEMGLVTLAIAVLNQHSLCVMTQSNAVMVARRDRMARQNGMEARS